MLKFNKNIICIFTALTALLAATVACDDSVSNIGASLIDDKVEIVMDSTRFHLQGNSVKSLSVQSRTTTQLIGRIDARGYGSFSSEIITQFMPGQVADAESFTANDIDSIKLVMQMKNGAYTGDSIMPMGIKVYPLKKQLETPIYSVVDDFSEYYDSNDIWGETIYSASAIGASDSIRALNSRNIEIKLPLSFAKGIYNEFRNNPSTFQSPQSFAQWFPGLYIANSFGNGRVTRIDKSYITMFYHVDKTVNGRDTTIYGASTYLAVTPEIITNNIIKYSIADDLVTRADNGEALLVAPIGYNVEAKFPAVDMVKYYRETGGSISMVNALSMEIPVEKIENTYGILPPPNILLVKKSIAGEFFSKNMLNDGINSFYATYSSMTNSYKFADMRNYFLDLLGKENVTDADGEFMIIPVNLVYESASAYNTSTIISGIVPYINKPVMCRLLLDNTKIKLIFSKQNVEL